MLHDTRQRITEEEHQERRAAIDFARASSGLEGLRADPEFHALQERYVAGEIDTEEFIKQTLADIRME
jgi:uncharacterized membrane protein